MPPQNNKKPQNSGLDTALNGHFAPSQFGIETPLDLGFNPVDGLQNAGNLPDHFFGVGAGPKKFRVQIKLGSKTVTTEFDHEPSHKEIDARAQQLTHQGHLAPQSPSPVQKPAAQKQGKPATRPTPQSSDVSQLGKLPGVAQHPANPFAPLGRLGVPGLHNYDPSDPLGLNEIRKQAANAQRRVPAPARGTRRPLEDTPQFDPRGSSYDRLSDAQQNPDTSSARVPYLVTGHAQSQLSPSYMQKDGNSDRNLKIAPDPAMSAAQHVVRHKQAKADAANVHDLQARVQERIRRGLNHNDLDNLITEGKRQLAIDYGNLGMMPNGHFVHEGDEYWNLMKSEASRANARADALVRSGRRKESDFDIRMMRFRAEAKMARLTGTPPPPMPYQITDDMRKDYEDALLEKQADSYPVVGGSIGAKWWAKNHPNYARQHAPTDDEVWNWETANHPKLRAIAHETYPQYLQRIDRESHEHYEKPVQDWAAQKTDDLGVLYSHEDPRWFLDNERERQAQAGAISDALSITPYSKLTMPFDALGAVGNVAEHGPMKVGQELYDSTKDKLGAPFERNLSLSERFNRGVSAAATLYDIYNTGKGAKEAFDDYHARQHVMHKYGLNQSQAQQAVDMGKARYEMMEARQKARPAGNPTRVRSASTYEDRYGTYMQRTGERARVTGHNIHRGEDLFDEFGKLKPEDDKKRTRGR